jgi:hypothetical protein
MFTLIWLAVLRLCVTLGQKSKSNMELIYFQNIMA